MVWCLRYRCLHPTLQQWSLVTIGGNNRKPDTTTTVMTAFTDDGGVAFKDAIIEALAWMDES